VLALAALAVGLHSARAASNAQQRARTAAARLAKLNTDAAELVRLRSEAAGLQIDEIDQTGLVGDVNSALVEAGVAVTTLTALTPDAAASADGAGGDWRASRRGARLTLERLTLPQLGRFLAVWRRDHPRWTVTSIQLQPLAEPPEKQTSPAAEGTRVQQPLRVYLVLESSSFTPLREPDQP